MKVIIVGGVAGGASAAARIRRLDETAQIIVFERSGYVSYANCGLPYYIGGVIEDRSLLTLQTPESFKSRFEIDVRIHHEVVAIHRERKAVTVRNLENGTEFEETVHAAHGGGYPEDPCFCRKGETAPRRAGRRGIHRLGAGGKPL